MYLSFIYSPLCLFSGEIRKDTCSTFFRVEYLFIASKVVNIMEKKTWWAVGRDGNDKETGKWISEISVSVSMRIRSVLHPRGGNWKETGKRISEISEFVSMRIRSVSILSRVKKMVNDVDRMLFRKRKQ